MYLGMLSEQGNVVEDEEAFDYALERCLKGTLEEQQEFGGVFMRVVLLRKLGVQGGIIC